MLTKPMLTAIVSVPTLLLAACQAGPRPERSTDVAATAIVYRCDDGRQIQASYPDHDTAVLQFDDHRHVLHVALSASGARYIGDRWQWWTRGMHEGSLAPLRAGETIASATGTDCTAR